MTSANQDSVRVDLGERAYDIHVGDDLLDRAGDLIAPFLARPRVVVVTDENVAAAQYDRLASGLAAAKIETHVISLAPGEATKSFAELEGLVTKLLDLGVERNDLVLALGGGVIGDLTGFACAILRRGCRYGQVPTSLLAQVDSSVGGKTAINVSQGKNLVGAFYQPAIVIADIAALKTLPARELRAGYAEIVKYCVIGDASFFSWLEENGKVLIAGDAGARRWAVTRACEMKAQIVKADEREAGERALLNLGHTFGHAIEAAYNYSDAVLHGEAVAIGMRLAADYSVRAGIAPIADADRLRAHLAAAGLPTALSDLPNNPDLTPETMTTLMGQDKKVEGGALTLILMEKIGRAKIVKNASPGDIRDFLEEQSGGDRQS